MAGTVEEKTNKENSSPSMKLMKIVLNVEGNVGNKEWVCWLWAHFILHFMMPENKNLTSEWLGRMRLLVAVNWGKGAECRRWLQFWTCKVNECQTPTGKYSLTQVSDTQDWNQDRRPTWCVYVDHSESSRQMHIMTKLHAFQRFLHQTKLYIPFFMNLVGDILVTVVTNKGTWEKARQLEWKSE